MGEKEREFKTQSQAVVISICEKKYTLDRKINITALQIDLLKRKIEREFQRLVKDDHQGLSAFLLLECLFREWHRIITNYTLHEVMHSH